MDEAVMADVRQIPTNIDEKALLRKIDFRVIPVLFIIYVAAFLDRVNIANALTLGLPADLHLNPKTNQANVALTIFFVPYILFEIPSNLLMRYFKPHVWCFYLISFWYKREEAQRRFTIYWCSVLVASMFGGLLASAIANMDGVRGKRSWRWIFILEGIATIVIGFAAFFLIADFPADAKWLTEEEREWVITRTRSDERSKQSIDSRAVLHFFSDIKNILAGIMYFCRCRDCTLEFQKS
ncbi:MAG: hypothetical protein Q9182_004229 [Xanthomendoza sp. 2 TL-2023]